MPLSELPQRLKAVEEAANRAEDIHWNGGDLEMLQALDHLLPLIGGLIDAKIQLKAQIAETLGR
jgi:hypothetical protein